MILWQLRLKLAWARLMPWLWWRTFWAKTLLNLTTTSVMILPTRKEKTMETKMTYTLNPLDTRLELAGLVQLGSRRLQQQREEAQAREAQEQIEIAAAWNDYFEALRSTLPVVLQPYAVKFEEGLRYRPDPDRFQETLSLDFSDEDLAPILAHLDRHSFKSPFAVTCYTVPGLEHYTDEDNREHVCWLWGLKECGYENVDAVKTNDLALALALAYERHEQMTILKVRLARQAAAPAEKEPEYIEVEPDEMPMIADKALAASVRAIVRDEMFRPPHGK